MILSGFEILKEIENGNIVITPFDRSRLNPNSYNLRLFNELLVYDTPVLDMRKAAPYHLIEIPEEGLVLQPKTLYLGRTVEFTETKTLVPMLEGRSSVGRLGITVHVTAGFGDVGFKGFWTLEIQCINPVRVYPYVEFCQIYYHTICGEYDLYKSGKYQGNNSVQPSLMYMDFKDNNK